jgi:selenocysteine lyase/cysteine desulfurase
VDAIQGLGVIPMDVVREGIDFLAADAHKWVLGPEGIGVFYCRRDLCQRLHPALIGWRSMVDPFAFESPKYELRSDAQRFEEGSQNLMGIFGLGAAMGLLREIGIETIQRRVQDLGDVIMAQADRRGFEVKTPRDRRARGGIVTVAGDFDAGNLRDALRDRLIMVNVRAGGIRISPHFYNTEEEILNCFAEIDGITEGRRKG